MRLWVLALGLTCGAAMVFGKAMTVAADEPMQVLRHTVLYKFKDGLEPAKIQEVVDAFAGLPKKIETIIGFEHGTNVSKEGKSEGLTHCFVVTFRDEKGLATYLEHPAHQAYVQVVKDKRDKVVVFDYWTSALRPPPPAADATRKRGGEL
ncbi:MAG TPA: Dabb family protein [Pirellulales bacterium]|nr:Dabb family protein [Pirellulales bacterium]